MVNAFLKDPKFDPAKYLVNSLRLTENSLRNLYVWEKNWIIARGKELYIPYVKEYLEYFEDDDNFKRTKRVEEIRAKNVLRLDLVTGKIYRGFISARTGLKVSANTIYKLEKIGRLVILENIEEAQNYKLVGDEMDKSFNLTRMFKYDTEKYIFYLDKCEVRFCDEIKRSWMLTKVPVRKKGRKLDLIENDFTPPMFYPIEMKEKALEKTIKFLAETENLEIYCYNPETGEYV